MIYKKDHHKDKHYSSSIGKATRIGKVNPLFYVANDGSIYETEKLGLFQKCHKIVESDNEPDYEICKECGKVHNEIANRTYDNTPFSPFTNKQKVIAAPPEGNGEEEGGIHIT
jgi:hypothetical protein